MLQPVVRRTWAPRGETPIHHSWDRHDRLSVISAVSVGPRRRRMGLYFQALDHNVRTPEFVRFVRFLRRQLQAPILLILDRLNVHRSGVRELLRRGSSAIAFEWLPPYAPDLNPTEYVWNHTKFVDLANFMPDDVDHLGRSIAKSLRRQRGRPSLLRSFFKMARLKL